MQKCNNCSNEFQRKKIIKSIWLSWSYATIVCDKCNAKHYVNISTRLIVGLSIGFPLLIMNRFIHSGYYYLLGYFIWMALVIYLIPSIARYHTKTDEKD